MSTYTSITFTGDQEDHGSHTGYDIASEHHGSSQWHSAPSMGVHPIISQYSSGGIMSRTQANAIMKGAMDSEFANYGMSEQETYQAKQAFEMHIASGSVRLV